MKRLLCALLLLAGLATPALAQAPVCPSVDLSCPAFTFGFVPTPAQWQNWWASKQAALNFTPLNPASNLSDLSSQIISTQNLALGPFWVTGVNCNATGDTAIPITLRTANYIVEHAYFVLITGGANNVVASVNGTTSGGAPVIANMSGVASLSGAGGNVGVNKQSVYDMVVQGVMATGGGVNSITTYVNEATLYYHISTAQGSTCTANIYVYTRPAP